MTDSAVCRGNNRGVWEQRRGRRAGHAEDLRRERGPDLRKRESGKTVGRKGLRPTPRRRKIATTSSGYIDVVHPHLVHTGTRVVHRLLTLRPQEVHRSVHNGRIHARGGG